MPKLTQRMIDITTATVTKQVILRDSDLQCFGIRISSKSATYIVECRFQGKTKRVTVGKAALMTVEEAREKARQILAKMSLGVDPDAEKKSRLISAITLNEVLEVYLATKQLRPSTIRAYRRITRHAFKDWLYMPVVQITKDAVEDKHRAMAKGTRYGTSGKAYANCCFKILQALLNFANEKYEIDGQQLIQVNPVSRLTKTRAWYRVHPRTGVIPEYKLRAWYTAVQSLKNPSARDYFLLLLFTGLRRREGSELKWTDVDLIAETITVRRYQAKNHRDHVLPLSKFVLDLLRQRYERRSKSEYVFPGHFDRGHLTDYRMHLYQAREQTGIKFMVHDLRRTFMSAAERLDLPYYVLKRLANHVVSSDTLVPYIVVSMERLKLHMERISQHFLELMQAEECDAG